MSETQNAGRHTAGLFDIRNVIGALMGCYGIILTIMSFAGDKALDKTGGIDANLIGGIVLIVIGVVFIAWSYLRPTYVPDADSAAEPAAEEQA